MTDARVGHAGHQIDIAHVLVAAGQRATAAIAGILDVHALVARRRVAVIDPHERTYLLALAPRRDLAYAVGRYEQRLRRLQLGFDTVIEVSESRALRGYRIAVASPADNHRRAAVLVARSIDALRRQDQHRARPFHLALHQLDSLAKGVAQRYERSDQLGRVDPRGGQLGEVQPATEQLPRQLFEIVDTPDGHQRKAAQMRGERDRLPRALETGQIVLELVAEIGVLQRMDGPYEILSVVKSHAAALGAQMRVIIGAVEDVSHAVPLRDTTEKAAHTVRFLRKDSVSGRISNAAAI